MRDYALLAKAFRHCEAKKPCGDCPMYENCPDIECRKNAADAIEELLARDVVPTDFHERCLQLEIRKRIELEKQVPHWISVEERLPENAGQMCLVCAKNSFGQQSVFNAFTGYGDFKWYTYDTTKTEDKLGYNNAVAPVWEITHWMPLPAPPKGVE